MKQRYKDYSKTPLTNTEHVSPRVEKFLESHAISKFVKINGKIKIKIPFKKRNEHQEHILATTLFDLKFGLS